MLRDKERLKESTKVYDAMRISKIDVRGEKAHSRLVLERKMPNKSPEPIRPSAPRWFSWLILNVRLRPESHEWPRFAPSGRN